MNPYIIRMQKGPQSGRFSKRARVELLPLIDVMFLLVAFFMVISISMVMQKGIFVDLSPAETSDTALEEEDTLVVSVDSAGAFFLNKKKISEEKLGEVLLLEAKGNRDIPVVINADRDARHESVIQALDLVRKADLHTVIFSVEPEE